MKASDLSSPLEVLQNYEEVIWSEDGNPTNLEEGQWSRQSPPQNHTLLEEERTLICFFKNFPEILKGIEIGGPLHKYTEEIYKKKEFKVYYVNAFYRGDIGKPINTKPFTLISKKKVKGPVMKDIKKGVDYIFKYDDKFILALDPFTSTIPFMKAKKKTEAEIDRATKRPTKSREHLRGKEYENEYSGYTGLLDLAMYSYITEKETNEHTDWLTRLKEGIEFSDYKKDSVLKDNIFVVAVYKDKNYYLFGKKNSSINDLEWVEDMDATFFKDCASQVGNKGKGF